MVLKKSGINVEARLRIIVLNILTLFCLRFVCLEILEFYPVDKREPLEIFEKCVMKFSLPIMTNKD